MLALDSLALLTLLIGYPTGASRAEVHLEKSDALHITALGRSVRHTAADAGDTPLAAASVAEEETTTTIGAAAAEATVQEGVDTRSGGGSVVDSDLFDYNSTMTHADNIGKLIDSLKNLVSTVLTAKATGVEVKSSKYAGLLNEQDAGMRAMGESVGLYRLNLKDKHTEHLQEMRRILTGSGEGRGGAPSSGSTWRMDDTPAEEAKESGAGRKCEKPNDAGGTLAINGCENCVKGQVDCKCDVRCADGNFHNEHTGLEGHKTCSVLPHGGVGFADLPTCSPKCKPPNDQNRTLDVSHCPLSCLASVDGKGEACNCQVECFGKPSKGENGKKACIIVPGKDGRAARSEWHPAIPSCLAPVWYKVNNAATGTSMAGVDVSLYRDEERTRKLSSAKTDKDGMVLFHTDLPVITLSTDNGDGWVEAVRVLDRVKDCKDPKNCGGQVAISERMQGTDLELENDGCFFTGENWSMRVVLEWDAKPSDLDLWGRWVHPDGDGGSAWVKFSNKVGWPMVHCVSYGHVHAACLPEAHCKWDPGSSWQRTCLPINQEPTPKPRLTLDVDKRQGYGPETLSFWGVRPGYYQIVVNRYGSREGVRVANPHVQIYLGGRSTQFQCQMQPGCTKESENWQAVNIWITKVGEKDGKPRYQVRLLHTEDDILKLRAYELGVRTETQAKHMCHGECWADMNNPDFERCLTNPAGRGQSRGAPSSARSRQLSHTD